MGDDWFGHRDPFTGAPVGDREEYTSWDFSLLNAFQTIEDYTDQKSGIPIWELDDERIVVEAVRKKNKFQAAIDLTTKGTEKKPYKPQPGEYFVPRMYSRETDENGEEVYQTFTQWVNKTVEEDSD
jgi:hypothetical protein